MEWRHEILYMVCRYMELFAAYQALVNAHYKLALVGFVALWLLLLVGIVLYYLTKGNK